MFGADARGETPVKVGAEPIRRLLARIRETIRGTDRPWSFDGRAANLAVGGIDVKMLIVAVVVAVAIAGSDAACAQSASVGKSTLSAPILLVDSTGKIAAKALNDTMMLITVQPGVVAPAFIHPIYDADGRAASGLATWASDGSVLFASADCTSGAHVFSSTHAGVRATSQVATPEGTILFIGAIGTTTTIFVRSILYGNGCSPVTVQQNGLIPVVMTVNLTTAYPPPLSFQ
jgi:hypothetical protein